MSWNPAQYRKFANERLRPGLDLMAQIPDLPPDGGQPPAIYDLGCGTGQLTAMLAARWPAARVTGIDGSPAMLAEARSAHPPETWPGITWMEGDVGHWRPPAPADLIFSNAALHWLGDHATLIPRLVGCLKPQGVLAVQMPRNFEAPSHALLYGLAEEYPWIGRIRLRRPAVLAPEDYYDLLMLQVASVDIWETTYLHVLSGDAPVLDWVRGTALLPVLGALHGAERTAFIAEYGRRLAAAYPRRPDGKTLFPFRRLFLIARR